MTETPHTAPAPAATSTAQVRCELSVVIPMFNEADNLQLLIEKLTPVLERASDSFEVVFVDDGSSDGTLEGLRRAHQLDPRFNAVSFSRNFGKEIAIAAGLDHARGDAVIIMDADLQHPPEMIETFMARWREGYENVYGQRVDRTADSPMRRMLTMRFYKMFANFGETELPPGAGDFRLLDRKAVNALRAMPERARFSKGLYAWIGFRSIGVPFEVQERAFGQSKFSYRKLTRFALDGLMSFSTLPLKVWTYVGTIVSVFALATAVFFVFRTITHGADVPGYASLIVSIMFFAGVQLMSLGILGEYIGRIFAEVKRRPLYLVGERIGVEGGESPMPPPRPGSASP
jgi:glycosyltransferase involved in cell wall biosynthesis